jgi:DNA-binding beta-propeller fold protein YncE
VTGVPSAIGVTADGRTAYVASARPSLVTVIRTATGTVLRQIKLKGLLPNFMAITPDGNIAYVGAYAAPSGRGPDTVIPIWIASSTVLRPIKVGHGSTHIVIVTPKASG